MPQYLKVRAVVPCD